MYRMGLPPDSVHAETSDMDNSEKNEIQKDVNDYFQTEEAHLPVIGYARVCGLLPNCLRYPLASQLGVHKELVGNCCHKTNHVLMAIYSGYMFLIMFGTAVGGIVWLIMEKVDKSTGSVFWMTFDIITYFQVAALQLTLIVKTGDLGWLMSSLDFFMSSFHQTTFLRTDIAELMANEKQNRLEEELRNPGRSVDALGPTPPRGMYDEQSRRRRTRTARKQKTSVAPEQDVEEEEEEIEIDFTEMYLKKSRMWSLLLTVIFSLFVGVIVGYLVYGRTMNHIIPIYNEKDAKKSESLMPKMIPNLMISWILKKTSSEAWPLISTIAGLCLEANNVLYQCIPVLIFLAMFISVNMILEEFNERILMARESYLEIDRTIVYHHRLRTLVKRMEKCLGACIMVAIAGDFFAVACGTYLGFWRTCDWRKFDSTCISYLLRHAVMVVRLLFIGGFGAMIQNKLNFTVIVLDGYMSKSILNTERLKIMGLLCQNVDNGFSICGFFTLTKPFFLGLIAVSIGYIAIMMRIVKEV